MSIIENHNDLPQSIIESVKEKGGFEDFSQSFDDTFKRNHQFIRELTKFAQSFGYDKKPGYKLHSGFISSYEINAFACSTQSLPPADFIGIYGGVLISAVDISYRLFSTPNFYPEIGAANQERIGRAKLNTWNQDILKRNRCEPLDPERVSAAIEFSHAIMAFVFFHEFTHIAHGHTDLSRELYNISDISEIVTCKEKEIPYELRHTLETDADSGSICYFFDYARWVTQFIYSPKITELVRKDLDSLYGSPIKAIKSIALATTIFFKLFGPDKWDPTIDTRQNHPGNAWRRRVTMMVLYERAKTLIKHGLNCDEETVLQTIRDAEFSIDEAFSEIFGTKCDYSAIISVYEENNDEALSRMTQFKRSWGEIRSKLEPYVRGVNIPPADTD